MSKSLQKQIDYAHEQFDSLIMDADMWTRGIKYDSYNCEELATEDIEIAEIYLSIINSLTELIEQDNQSTQFDAVQARKELRHAKVGIK